MAACITAENIMTIEQYKRLIRDTSRELEGAILYPERYLFIRDHYLFVIAFHTGLRVAELSALTWGDIDFDREKIYVRNGKGGKRRDVSLGKKGMRSIREYRGLRQYTIKDLPSAEECDSIPVFMSMHHTSLSSKRLSPNGMHRRLKFWLAKCGMSSSLSMHSFRHGYATHMLDSEVNLRTIQSQLGHSNISTTSVYLHFTQSALEKLKAAS